MKLVEFCVRRPVFTTVMTIALLIVGVVSYNYLSIRQYPRIDFPIVSVTTQYEGASPQIVESRLTRVLESALAGIEGVSLITSVSADESSRINLAFRPNYDIDAAASDVRDRIGRVRSRMPEGVRDPVVKKSDADAAPIIFLALYQKDSSIHPAEMYDYFKQHLEAEFEALPGVSGVEAYGSSGHTMRVWLDPVKMASFKITTQDVSAALRQQNVHIPAGRVRSENREYMVTTAATLKSPEAFNDVIVSTTDKKLVRISDIGHAEFVPEPDKQTFAYYNKQPAIAIGLVKKSVANPLEVRAELTKMIPDLQKSLPKGLEITVAYDKTAYVSAALNEVGFSFFEAVLFVSIVVFCFLWSGSAALIPLVTIPVSLAGTAILLYIFGFSINTLTLLAVVLAIGLVVDDAIIIMENIHRHLSENKKMSALDASIKGGSEIAFAVIAMTLTLAAVYFPITLARGAVGKFFTEFAVTMAGAVLVSGWAALTLSPMMCAILFKRRENKSRFVLPEKVKNFLNLFYAERYIPRMEQSLKRSVLQIYSIRKGFMFIIILLSSLGIALFMHLPKELVPKEDQGLINVSAMIPQGATPQFLDRYMKETDEILQTIPEIESRLTIVAQPNPMSWTFLKPWSERKRTSVQIIDQELRQKLKSVAGLHVYASPGSTILGSGASDEYVQFVLETTKSYNDLDTAAQLVESALRAQKILPFLTTDRGEDTQEFVVDIDRDKAMLMGVNMQTIAETLDTFVSGRRLTDYRRETEQYDVIASVRQNERESIADLGRIHVRGGVSRYTGQDMMIPLEQLIDIKTNAVPLQINHHNQLRSVTLSGELAAHVSLGDAVEIFKDIAYEVLPEGVRYEFAGQTKQYLESRYLLLFVFSLAVIFIYLVLAAQFESFLDPLIILFTVPLSLAGALTTLACVGGSMNIYTQVGLITLIGLITKHGILIVDFANKKRRQDKTVTPINAAVEAVVLRLRPILMTTAAMIMGAVPLIIAVGAGAESRRQIGWVIAGGMIIGTFFTLFVVPLVYDAFVSISEKRRSK
ncbi:MAG: efflux RND transporter permease subunit [Alphaproteobacteria bacterium]|nr:efflux RND transporter permease subunit [Alphaproteobacteria bacterium]